MKHKMVIDATHQLVMEVFSPQETAQVLARYRARYDEAELDSNGDIICFNNQ